MSMLTSWSPFFQSNVRMRGRAYQSSHRVERVEPEAGELVRAHVQGQEQYLVTIRREGSRAVAECTCPHFEGGAYCKHIWATLLDIQQNEEGPGAKVADLANLRVRAPKARKREGGARRPVRSAEPEWIGRLSLLRPPTDDLDRQSVEGMPAQRQICYVVLPEASARHQGLVVELRQRTPIATGWSRTRPLKLASDELAALPDPVDRELCALLLGGMQVDPHATFGSYNSARAHATYQLPPGAWRSLLKRMISTGQCFLDTDEDASGSSEVPLRWDADAAWSLWMVGREAQEELEVTVELRRNNERMSIERPRLLLGGADGVVIWEDQADPASGLPPRGPLAAPFDDRDAYRWAAQFRDEHRRREEPRPIKVPRPDLDRFLDRLYMLPQIPEIDLPEGVGRVPQHVELVPHLDLYSPESAMAAQLLPASAKNQLVGRAWFAYGSQRVTPGQPGRFVTISSSASLSGGADVEGEPLAEPAAVGAEAEQVTEGEAEVEAGAPITNGHPPAEDAVEQDAPETEASDPDADDAEDATATADEDRPPAEGLLIRRNRRAERDAMAVLAAQGLRPLTSAGPDTLVLPAKQMPEAVDALLARGWQVLADDRAVRHAGAPSFSITSGLDWFELRGGIRYQRDDGVEQEIPLPQILAAVRSGQQLITLSDGSQGLLPEQWLQSHGLLTSLGKLEDDHLRFKSSQAAMLDALLDDQELRHVDDTYAKARQRLHEFRGIEPIAPADDFKGELRPYQREGLGWMAFLRWFGVGGVLADDMGLGKTIQVLAVLQARKLGLPAHCDTGPDGERAEHLPALVVAPRSVVFNWADEAHKFTPDLRVQAYTGADREALRASFSEQDVIITSYGLLRRDIDELREHRFDYVILDEAQAIKNPASQAAKAVRLLTARHRLALTGTPVENHLGDLWSIFEFLNPGMLGSSARFSELVRASSTNANNGHANLSRNEAIEQVAKGLRPFILRRTKKQVLKDLPEKTEQTIVCEMEAPQRQVYDELRQYYRSHLFQRLDAAGGEGNGHGTVGGKAGFMVLEALLRLRQAACHPGLISEDRADLPSAKLDVLLELLADIIEEDSKALVFSQFTSMLGLVRRKLEERGIRYCYLDGQTRDRREVVQRFQNDPKIPVFLISLKTGGFGLNLTAAEYVFILDPWWNPAVEQQAIDRTHRIGQTRRVFAYRLICEDTVEQRITDLQQRKRQIADAIVGGEQNVLQNLTREDLEQLLS